MNDEFTPFRKEDISQGRFYRIPKTFVEDEHLRKQLDSNMKLMYALLRDRYELSLQNNWIDKSGAVYCIYSREHLAIDLDVSKNTVSKCIKQLTKLNLMKEIRNGQGKPNHMYISKVKPSHINRNANFGILDSQNIRPNDTEYSETEDIYIVGQANDDFILQYYSIKYQNHFGKEHPPITSEQLEKVNSVIEEFSAEYDAQEEDWENAIDEHFNNLPKNNNGSILSFCSGNLYASPLVRYLEAK